MKVTGLLLFLIMLIVLVISVVIGNKTGSLWKEGFANYQKSVVSGNSFIIPTYSSTNNVTKLFDNVFYDQANGNIVEIDSPQFIVGGNIDLAGTSIVSTIATSRNNPSASSKYGGNVTLLADGKPQTVNISESAIASMSTSFNSYKYISQSKNTDRYCLFYIPWSTNTYMHMIDMTTNAHVATYSHLGANGGNKSFQSKMWPVDSNGVPNMGVGLTDVSIDSDRNNNALVTDNYYDSKKVLYQVSQYVKYDVTNGNLLMRTATGAIVYSRGNPVTSASYTTPNNVVNTPSTVSNVSFSPTLLQDTLGNNTILYIPDGLNTLIAVISLEKVNGSSATDNGYYRIGNTNITYKLTNVVRFTEKNIDNGSNSNTSFASMINSFMNGSGGYNSNTNYGGSGSNNLDDYMLKTQVVPPVCPSCPSCGNGGVCGNCGGQGGSGTQSGKGGTMVTGSGSGSGSGSGTDEKKNNPYDLFDEHSIFGEGTPTTGKKDASGNDIEWKNEIGKGTFSSNADPNTLAGGFLLSQYSAVAGLEEGAYTAADVAKTGIGAVGGAVKDVTGGIGSAATGLGKGISGAATGAADLAKSAGSGVMQMSREGRNAQGQGSVGNVGGPGSVGNVGGLGSVGNVSQGPGSVGNVSQGPGSVGPITNQGMGSSGVSYSGPQSMDQYSYYGKLPAKNQSNYIPVTADFSSFRR